MKDGKINSPGRKDQNEITSMQPKAMRSLIIYISHVFNIAWHQILSPNADNWNYIMLRTSVWHRFHNIIKLIICKPDFLKKDWEQFDLSCYSRHGCRWFKNKAFNQAGFYLNYLMIHHPASAHCQLCLSELLFIEYLKSLDNMCLCLGFYCTINYSSNLF